MPPRLIDLSPPARDALEATKKGSAPDYSAFARVMDELGISLTFEQLLAYA